MIFIRRNQKTEAKYHLSVDNRQAERRKEYRIVELGSSKGSRLGTLAMYLLLLRKNGFFIPETHVLVSPALTNFSDNRSKLPDELVSQLSQIIDPEKTYSVFRSNEEPSKADFFGSVLRNQVRELGAIELKIMELLQKYQKSRFQTNASSANSTKDYLSLVIIQVPNTQSSGFVFTINPLNGMKQTILDVTGQLVSEKIQCMQLVFQNGKCVKGTPECFPCEERTIKRIISESSRIEKLLGKPVFLEWVYNGEELFWLKAKPLQSLEGLNVYSNKIAKDMLPGIILPLVWSINTPLVSSSWKRLITELIGKNNIDMKKMTKQFYYRAYFNMGIFGDFFDIFGMPRETLEIMMLGEGHGGNRPKMKMNMKMFPYLPRVGFFALRNVMVSKNINRFLRTQKRMIDSYNKDISLLNEKETLEAVDEIIKLNEQCSYNVIVVRLVRGLHHSIIRSLLSRKGAITKIGFYTEDLTDIDPKYSLFHLKEKYASLPQEVKIDLESGKTSPMELSYREFEDEYQRFVARFGHLSDSTVDMSKPQWRENPRLIINMIKGSQQVHEKSGRGGPEFPRTLSGFMLRRFYGNFIEYEKYSLRLGFLYAYGYSLFRNYFLHLGNIFKYKGYFPNDADIFYLTIDEIRSIVDSGHFESQYSNLLKRRKEEIWEYSEIVLPEVIFGDIAPPPIRKSSITEHLKGLPSSRGYYEGIAKVVMTLADFDKVEKGDVLVIPYSDASWT
ncbi:MAG TPA: hypothetical protein VMT42_00445, partial [candidate division Zixibacteria bacterium]|nr:hypothetical protein [candidate division Zixibacteria bacterium]